MLCNKNDLFTSSYWLPDRSSSLQRELHGCSVSEGQSSADILLVVPVQFLLKEHRQPPQQLTMSAHLVSVCRRYCPAGSCLGV